MHCPYIPLYLIIVMSLCPSDYHAKVSPFTIIFVKGKASSKMNP